jgi:hypothetical protein
MKDKAKFAEKYTAKSKVKAKAVGVRKVQSYFSRTGAMIGELKKSFQHFEQSEKTLFKIL